MKQRYYIKDKVDGQQHCLSGNEQFYLIDVTEELMEADKSQKILGGLNGMNYLAVDRDSLTFDEARHLHHISRGVIAEMLELALKHGDISQKERDIVYFRGIDWNSLETTGKKYGVTRERIRQIEAKVSEKLRQLAQVSSN